MTVWDSLNLIYIVYTNRRETLPNIQTLSSSQTITETNVLDFIGENDDNPKNLAPSELEPKFTEENEISNREIGNVDDIIISD